MSVEAVNQFLQKVGEDQQLQEELAKTIESNDDDRTAATQLGGRYGYEFTSDELAQEIQKRQSDLQQRQAQGQLSDEELEAVAGGNYTPLLYPYIGLPGISTIVPTSTKW